MNTRHAWVLHDDAATLAHVRALLATEGFDVASADSPYRALAAAPDTEPSLVLIGLTAIDDRDLDVVMLLRRRWPSAHMLVMFPMLLRERAARALERGADGYLPEPFYPAELTSLARHAAVSRERRLPAAATETPPAPAAASVATGRTDDDEALSKLAGGVAHTIRNPLQILELQIGAIEPGVPLDAADAENLRTQTRRIAAVVESLTRFSGRRKLATRLVDLNALVQRVFHGAGTGVQAARLSLSADRPEVLGAPELLRAALDAVKERAQRVTPPGREILVATALTSELGQPWAEISIADGGPLPSDDDLRRAFDPYPDADRVEGGQGLEMAAAAGVIRNHGGVATAARSDAPGSSGTTILVRLPARGGPPSATGSGTPQEARR